MTAVLPVRVPFRGAWIDLDPDAIAATLANRPAGPVEWAAAVGQADLIGTDHAAAMELLVATMRVVEAAEGVVRGVTAARRR